VRINLVEATFHFVEYYALGSFLEGKIAVAILHHARNIYKVVCFLDGVGRTPEGVVESFNEFGIQLIYALKHCNVQSNFTDYFVYVHG
jgi:hypothetical protein